MVFSKHKLLRGTALLCSFATFAGGIALLPAAAQDATECSDVDNDGICDADDSAIVPSTDTDTPILVTGSRISSPNLTSNVPVTSLGGEQFFEQGNINIGDTLNDLPQLRSTFAQQNPGLGIGIAGLNLLDLRGLGTQRTLVLVNGRRHVPADILNNAVSPDINSIPNDLIERVDIVTGSSSALYGSDAIAGVVNFILRDRYEGFQVRGQAGLSPEGFGGATYVSALAGHNYLDDRANITLHAEYAHQDRVFGSQIPALRFNDGLGTIDVDPATIPNPNGSGTIPLAGGSDGFADRAFFRDFRTTTNNRFGLIPINQRTGTPACGQAIVATNGAPSTTGGVSFSCTQIFTPEGVLVPQTGTRFGTGINSSILGGNGQTGREGELLSIYPEQDRYNFNLLASFDVTPGIQLFFEGKYNYIEAVGNNAGPSFIQGTQTQFDFRERPRLDNPFLGAANRTTLANLILASNCRPDLSVTCPATTNIGTTAAPNVIPGNLTPADRAAIAAGTYRFAFARSLLDVGIRDQNFTRETYRGVFGVRGNFNDDWKFELSANYGKFKETDVNSGYIDKQRFVLAMDAGLNPATGRIQCRSQYDAASAVILARNNSAAQTAALNAKLASDIAACVPYNPFGAADNRASADYFTYEGTTKSSIDQLDILGFVSGDLSQLFELPGGPVRFVIGGEYREENARYDQDPYLQTGLTNAVVIPTFAPDKFDVKEAFGEVQIPLLGDMPFFEDLTINGAARVSDYGGSLGTTFAWNAGVTWSPIVDLAFRANYGRAVRAPNVSETAFPLVPNFSTITDPCDLVQRNSNPNRLANCTADVGAANLANLNSRSYSLPIVSGSNPNLVEETSDSLTVGGVYRPSFVPGLSVSVDYYRIDVDNIITSATAQQILNSCYDQPTLTNIFCAQFSRFQGPGTGQFGELPGAIAGNTLIVAPLNYATRIREGIDTQISYNTTLGSDVKFGTFFVYTHGLKSSNFQDPTYPGLENVILEELGDPKDEFRLDINVGTGPFTFGYRMHYISPMYVNAYEDYNVITYSEGTVPADSSALLNLDYADTAKYPEVFYHDIRFDFDLDDAGFGEGFKFYVGMDNVLDTQPPLGSTATGSGSAIYDVFGRYVYAGFRARF
ncbi:TonB-dependent receptor domain-containing protein [Qipengyuania sp.]|uniref:TonB-dependent receptor domain-containing protein n=1 Tax=Qipengyuania sp. TaxID=2004515 RepID=UPI0035C7C37F